MSVIRALAAAAVALFCSIGAVHATPITYVFSGTGAGTINGVGFTGAFTFTFTGDTSAVDLTDPGFARLFSVGGTFTEGSYSATLAPTVTLVASQSPNNRINFFNATVDNGLGLQDGSLSSYDLTTSFGPVTVTDPALLTPTFGGGSFLTVGGDAISMTADRELTFSATLLGAPEPASIALIAIGLIALSSARRRR